MSIASHLTAYRDLTGFSQADAAERCGFSQIYWCNLERGVYTNPGASILLAIAEELEVSVEELVG